MSGKRLRKIDLIIFDLDGTLVDSHKDIADAVNFTLRSLGMEEKPLGLVASYVGDGVENLLRRSLEDGNRPMLEDAIKVFVDYFRQHSTDSSTLYPHVKEVLEYFKEKLKVLITNRRREFAILTLKALGIYGYFKDVIGGDDITCMKPNSCPLDNVLKNFHIEKEKAIMVGDMAIDIATGRAASAITCAVTYGLGRREDIINAAPDYIIDDIIRLKEIIDRAE